MKQYIPQEMDSVSDPIDLALIDCAKIVLNAAVNHNGGAYVDGQGAAEWIPLLDALGRFAKIIKGSGDIAQVLEFPTQKKASDATDDQ